MRPLDEYDEYDEQFQDGEEAEDEGEGDQEGLVGFQVGESFQETAVLRQAASTSARLSGGDHDNEIVKKIHVPADETPRMTFPRTMHQPMMMTAPSSPPSSRSEPRFRPTVLIRRVFPETGVDAGSDEHRLQVYVCDVRVGVGSVVVRMRVVVVIVVRMGLGFVRGPHTADRDGLVLESMLVTRDRNEMLVILGSADDHLPNRSPRSLPLPIPIHLLVHPLQPSFIHLLLLSARDQPVTLRILPSRALAVHPDFSMGAFVEPGLRV